MVKIELNDFSAEDFQYIQELQAMGLSDELIQLAYNNTQDKRKNDQMLNRTTTHENARYCSIARL